MIDQLLSAGESLLFGLGVAFLFTGLLLLYQLFVKKVNFSSPLMVSQIGIILTALGSAFLHFVVL